MLGVAWSFWGLLPVYLLFLQIKALEKRLEEGSVQISQTLGLASWQLTPGSLWKEEVAFLGHLPNVWLLASVSLLRASVY